MAANGLGTRLRCSTLVTIVLFSYSVTSSNGSDIRMPCEDGSKKHGRLLDQLQIWTSSAPFGMFHKFSTAIARLRTPTRLCNDNTFN